MGEISFRLLNKDEIDVRISQCSEKGVGLLLFKDARVDMNILDETVGTLNWQREHFVVDSRLCCTVSIWDDDKKQWVSKQDVGTESYTEKDKGQFSDSFKRACFNVGIGRELYTAPFIWFNPDLLSKSFKQDAKGKWVCYDRFEVVEIHYCGRVIDYVKIKNTKNGKTKAFGSQTDGIPADPIEDDSQKLITDKEAIILEGMLAPNQKEWVLQQFKLTNLTQLTSAQYAQVMQSLQKKEKDGK